MGLRVSKLLVIGNCEIKGISVQRKEENIERERDKYICICMCVTNGLGFQEEILRVMVLSRSIVVGIVAA